MPDVMCCGADSHSDAVRVLHDRTHPRCRSCGRRGQEVAPLRYQRSDGANCMSYPTCSECSTEKWTRLESLGFTPAYGVAIGGGHFVWPQGADKEGRE